MHPSKYSISKNSTKCRAVPKVAARPPTGDEPKRIEEVKELKAPREGDIIPDWVTPLRA